PGLGVGVRPAPVLHEEQPQVLLCGAQVLPRVERAQHLVLGHQLVEAPDDPVERRLTADGLVEVLRYGHTVYPALPASSAGELFSGRRAAWAGGGIPALANAALIPASSARCTAHCRPAATLVVIRSVTPSELIDSTPSISGGSSTSAANTPPSA